MKTTEMKYERTDVDAWCKMLESYTEKVKAASSADEVIAIREEFVEENVKLNHALRLCSMRHLLDTRDEFYAKEQEYYDQNTPKLAPYDKMLMEAVLNSPYIKEVEKKLNPAILKGYRAAMLITDEKLIADNQEEAAAVSEYQKIMAEMMFEWKGKTVTRSEILAAMSSTDRNERKAATEVFGKRLEKDGAKIDEIYDRLVHIRDRKAKKMGFKNFCEMGDMAMNHLDYGRKEVGELRKSVINYAVPVISKLKREQAEEFGYDKFMFYDDKVFLKDGNPDPILSPEEIFKAGSEMYHDMNPDVGAKFDFMVENEAFDYMPREGKWGGGFSEGIPLYKQNFILANFNGTADDVEVLTHEFGHAYANLKLYDNNIDPEISEGGMETAETHSMSMEMFCDKYNGKFYGDKEVEATYKHIAESLCFIPYGTMVDYFQERVYENPDMTPAQRNELWLELEKTFRPYMSYDDIPYLSKGTRWQYQQHIIEVPFYYIDYVIAQQSALQFMLKLQKDYDAAFADYLKLVNCGGTKPYAELCRAANLGDPFDSTLLKTVSNDTLKVIEDLKSKF